MNIKPIIFSTEMVKSILDGRKTQTRRVIKPQPFIANGAFQFENKKYTEDKHCYNELPEDHKKFDDFLISINPYGQVGDRLWVRETFFETPHGYAIYKADEIHPDKLWKWKPSIFMPKEYSRITLEITDIRVERVQDISESDCRKEGIKCIDSGFGYIDYNSGTTPDIKYSFQTLWDSINKKRGYGWDVNPWVWVVEFKLLEPK